MQRIGILKLVQQNMPVARIQLVLHVLGLLRIGQQPTGLPFDIGKVNQLACLFDLRVMRQQRHAASDAGQIEMIGACSASAVDADSTRSPNIACSASKRSSPAAPRRLACAPLAERLRRVPAVVNTTA